MIPGLGNDIINQNPGIYRLILIGPGQYSLKSDFEAKPKMKYAEKSNHKSIRHQLYIGRLYLPENKIPGPDSYSQDSRLVKPSSLMYSFGYGDRSTLEVDVG